MLQTLIKTARSILHRFSGNRSTFKLRRGLLYKIDRTLVRFLSTPWKQTEFAIRSLEAFERKIAPVRAKLIGKSSPPRVTILLSEINFEYFSGGYIGMLNFGKLLNKLGYKVRIFVTDQAEINLDDWKVKIENYKGLEDIFEFMEFGTIYDRTKTYEFYANEQIVATSWWTAHIAESIRRQLQRDRFIYFIQEFEPLFYAFGSHYSLALQSYSLPHHAVFSTEILCEYFKLNSIGVFSHDDKAPHTTFRNAIINPQRTRESDRERKRGLLFYFRPEFHAARNMYETGFSALNKAVADLKPDPDRWRFCGIGSLLPKRARIPLTAGYDLEIIPKVSLAEYEKLLCNFDVGFSLMMSPHPSLVPLEMCAAGMLTVTNTFANKTATVLNSISNNFIPADPDIDSIAESLKLAINAVESQAKRSEGAINWPTDWNESFGDDFINSIRTYIDNG